MVDEWDKLREAADKFKEAAKNGLPEILKDAVFLYQCAFVFGLTTLALIIAEIFSTLHN
jgi:hypothetical protein